MTNPLNAFALAALALVLTPLAGAGTAYAAASLAPGMFSSPPSLVQRAECEDECQDVMEAREQAVEAQQDAAREAREYREEFAPRQEYERQAVPDRGASRRAAAKEAEPAPRAKPTTGNPVATAKTETPAKADKITTADTSEPKVIEKVIEKIEKSDASTKSASGKGCKQYFAAIGMTLSVPCEK